MAEVENPVIYTATQRKYDMTLALIKKLMLIAYLNNFKTIVEQAIKYCKTLFLSPF